VTQVGLQRSRIVASHTLVMLLDISLQIGRRHETRTNSDRADELMAQYAEHGFHYWVASASLKRGRSLLALGCIDEARPCSRAGQVSSYRRGWL
jgi:hypothetical protein